MPGDSERHLARAANTVHELAAALEEIIARRSQAVAETALCNARLGDVLVLVRAARAVCAHGNGRSRKEEVLWEALKPFEAIT